MPPIANCIPVSLSHFCQSRLRTLTQPSTKLIVRRSRSSNICGPLQPSLVHEEPGLGIAITTDTSIDADWLPRGVELCGGHEEPPWELIAEVK